jgi:hypothetical protein
LLDTLRGAFLDSEIFFVVDERRGPVLLPDGVAKVSVTDATLTELGVFAHPNWGWLCGDYFYYSLRAHTDKYEYYWLCEPDVFFSLDSTAEFFRSFERDEAAFLAATFSKRQGLGWFWEKCLPFLGVNELYGALFPLTRLSGPAIDHLRKRRIALEDRYQSDKERIELWPNDECFVSSMLTADGFACKDLASGPIAGLFGKFSTDTPYLISCLQSETPSQAIVHPVLTLAKFVDKFILEFNEKRPCDRTKQWIATVTDSIPDAKRSYLLKRLLLRPHTRVAEKNKTGKSLSVVARQKIVYKAKTSSAALASVESFTLAQRTELSLLDRLTMTPYAYDWDRRVMGFVDSTPSVLDAAFLYEAQFNSANYYYSVHLEELIRRGHETTEAIANYSPTFVFSTGRCGSTLISKLAAAVGLWSFSEPDILTDATRHLDHPDLVPVIQHTVSSLLAFSRASDVNCLFKLRSTCNSLIPAFQRAFPKAKYVFILSDLSDLSDLRDWSTSFIEKFNSSDQALVETLLQGISCIDYMADNQLPHTVMHYERFARSPETAVALLRPNFAVDDVLNQGVRVVERRMESRGQSI